MGGAQDFSCNATCSTNHFVSDKIHDKNQRAKKILSDSPGLLDFAIGLVNSVVNLPDGQVMFYEEFE